MISKKTVILSTLCLASIGTFAWIQLAQDQNSEQLDHAESLSTANSVIVTSSAQRKESHWTKLTDQSIRWQVRVDMLKRMDGKSLSKNDIDMLFHLMSYRPNSQNSEDWWVTVNEIMEQMRLQGIGSDRYTRELLAVLEDESSPEVLRDYAVQHLGQWVSPRGKALGRPHEQNRKLIQEVAVAFGLLVSDPTLAHTSIPGTTLMVLVDMKEGGVSADTINSVFEKLSPWMRGAIQGDTNISKITRVSAINTAGILGRSEFLEDIRYLAVNSECDFSIRLNSISALGHIGEEVDLQTLKDISRSDSRCRFAAQSALSKLYKTREN